jgi:hypothetical protein
MPVFSTISEVFFSTASLLRTFAGPQASAQAGVPVPQKLWAVNVFLVRVLYEKNSPPRAAVPHEYGPGQCTDSRPQESGHRLRGLWE